MGNIPGNHLPDDVHVRKEEARGNPGRKDMETCNITPLKRLEK